jgi:hypothetical protein
MYFRSHKTSLRTYIRKNFTFSEIQAIAQGKGHPKLDDTSKGYRGWLVVHYKTFMTEIHLSYYRMLELEQIEKESDDFVITYTFKIGDDPLLKLIQGLVSEVYRYECQQIIPFYYEGKND